MKLGLAHKKILSALAEQLRPLTREELGRLVKDVHNLDYKIRQLIRHRFLVESKIEDGVMVLCCTEKTAKFIK